MQDALQEFYGKDKQTKQNIINKIFANPGTSQVAGKGQSTGIGAGLTASGGFGLQKFVKQHKGSAEVKQMLEKYRGKAQNGDDEGHSAGSGNRAGFSSATKLKRDTV